jgi:transcriptional regulator with XRE-family HTH domain
MRIAQSHSPDVEETMDVVKTKGKRPKTGWIEFGERLRKKREELKFTRDYVAQYTSLDSISLYRIERGDQWISAKALQELSALYKTAAARFFEDAPSEGGQATTSDLRSIIEALLALDDQEMLHTLDLKRAEAAGARGEPLPEPLEKTFRPSKSTRSRG